MEGKDTADRASLFGFVSRALQCILRRFIRASWGGSQTTTCGSSRSGTSAVQQLAAGTGFIGYVGYAVHAIPTMAKGAPVRWATIEDRLSRAEPGSARFAGRHLNAARLLVHFLTSIEGLKAYCDSGDGSMAALDPTGKNTGCEPLAADAHFLPGNAAVQGRQRGRRCASWDFNDRSRSAARCGSIRSRAASTPEPSRGCRAR